MGRTEVGDGVHLLARRLPDSDLPVCRSRRERVSDEASCRDEPRRRRGGGGRTRVDGGDGHEDAGPAGEGAAEVGDDGEHAEDGASDGGGRGDDALELLVERRVARGGEDHLLVLELLGHLAGSRARDLDPRLGEEGALRITKGGVSERKERADEGQGRTAETVKVM